MTNGKSKTRSRRGDKEVSTGNENSRNTKFNSRNNSRNSKRGVSRRTMNSKSQDNVSNARISNSCDNDLSWYVKDQSILNSIASFSFGRPLGDKIPVSDANSRFVGSGNIIVPGIMSYYTNPAITNVVEIDDTNYIMPSTVDPTLTLAIQQLYSYVRHANSGHSNYDAPDLMLYILAVSELHAMHAWFRRLYGTLTTYSPMNRFFPKRVINSMGVDFEELQTEQQDLLAYINITGALINQLYIPDVFSYIHRHIWMFSHIYADTTQRKPQVYMYNPWSTWEFDEIFDAKLGSTLQPIPWCSKNSQFTVQSWHDYATKLTKMVNAVLSSESMGIMSGDILKAYGADHMVTVPGVDVTFSIIPEYSDEVLTQFENIRICGLPKALLNTGITDVSVPQDSQMVYIDPNRNTLVHCPCFGGDAIPNFAFYYPANFHTDVPTPGEVMVATRGMAPTKYASTPAANTYLSYMSAGVTDYVVVAGIFNNVATAPVMIDRQVFADSASEATYLSATLPFDRCIPFGLYTTLSSGITAFSWHGRWDNLRPFTTDELDVINRGAFLAMLT